MGKYTSKAGPKGAVGESSLQWQDAGWERDHPAIKEFMSEAEGEDGRPRQTTTVLLLCDAGCLKAWVNDRQNRRTLWVTAACVVDLFAAVETALADGDGEWRAAKAEGAKNYRKKT